MSDSVFVILKGQADGLLEIRQGDQVLIVGLQSFKREARRVLFPRRYEGLPQAAVATGE